MAATSSRPTFPLRLPVSMRMEADQFARDEGISLNQFIMLAVAEKMSKLQSDREMAAVPSSKTSEMDTLSVFGSRFAEGRWEHWEHICVEQEVEAVVDSAEALASDRSRKHSSLGLYLAAAAYVFDRAYGETDAPEEGDLRVHAAVVDELAIGKYESIERHFRSKLGAG